jgi:hypothetical protein
MSFFNKIIDRAKQHGNKEDNPKSSDQLSNKDSNRSFFGIHTPHSSTSSNNNNQPQSSSMDQQLPKVPEEQQQQQQPQQLLGASNYANGYVTPRQSQDLHQNMDIDSPGN